MVLVKGVLGGIIEKKREKGIVEIKRFLPA